MPVADLPAFMAELRKSDNLSARALEFTILTATRTGEALGAHWSEIDLAARTWTVPAERMKVKKAEHVVPLSDRAIELLGDAGAGHVFSIKDRGPLSSRAMLDLLERMKVDCTVHGFRSTFSDWANDKTNHDGETIEHALAHSTKGKVKKAYRRGNALEKRARLMQSWADYCLGKDQAVVIPLRA
jgi:integrase